MGTKTVFISYRSDTAGKLFAGRVSSSLTSRGYDVFLDVNSLRSGPFDEQLERQVKDKFHFILVVTPGALEGCSNPDDWVRREFELAVRHKRNIVPVLEESVDWKELGKQTSSAIKWLFGLQTHTLRHSTFDSDVQTLTQKYLDVPEITQPGNKMTRHYDTARVSRPPSRWRAATIGFIDYHRLKSIRTRILEEWPGLVEPLIPDFETPHYEEFSTRSAPELPTKRILIINGPAGAGKTTYLDQLTRKLIRDETSSKVDLLVQLKGGELEKAVRDADYPALWHLIYSFVAKKAPLTPSAVAYALSKKRTLLLIEDLHWADSTTAVLQFVQAYFSEYHKNAWWKHITILGTTRETPERLSGIDGQIQTLRPLGQRDAQDFFWYLCDENAKELNLMEHSDALGRAFDTPSLQEPLFIVISASLVAHPSGSRLDVGQVLQMNTPQLFDKFIEKLYERSKLAEQTDYDYEAFRSAYENFAHAVWPLLGDFDEPTAVRRVSDLGLRSQQIDICALEKNGFLRRDPLGNLAFPHHAMAEFLTAAAMVRSLEFGKLTDNDQYERVAGLIPFLAALIKPPEGAALESLAKANLWIFVQVFHQHTTAVTKHEALAWKIPAIPIARAAGEWAKSDSRSPQNREAWEKLRDILDATGVSGWRGEFCKSASGATGSVGTDIEALAIVGGAEARYVLQDRLKGNHGISAFNYAIKTKEVQDFLLGLVETAGLQGELGRRSFGVLAAFQDARIHRLFVERVGKNFREIRQEDFEFLLPLGKDAQRTLAYACSKHSRSEKRRLCASAARCLKKMLIAPGEYEIEDQTEKITVAVKKPTLISCQPDGAGKHTLTQAQKYIARKVGAKNLLTKRLALVLRQHFEHVLNELYGPRFADPNQGEYEAFLHDGKIGLYYFYRDETGKVRIGAKPETANVEHSCEVVYHAVEEL